MGVQAGESRRVSPELVGQTLNSVPHKRLVLSAAVCVECDAPRTAPPSCPCRRGAGGTGGNTTAGLARGYCEELREKQLLKT
uniref:Uncharacterized protein n=1 Tax=Knipowitschia caucasica TaxID=637954 RepID=A0AAV2KBS7_KNICA